MHLAKLFPLLMASIAAAAPSIAYSQISVKVTNTAAQNHGHVVHSFQDVVTSLPFNFTLSARLLDRVGGPPNPSDQSHTDQSLPFGFASRENFPSGILGTKTEFTFRNGKLIVGNYVLSRQPARFIPPQVALWPLEYGSWFHLVVFREILASGKTSYFLEHAERSTVWGISNDFEPGEPVVTLDPQHETLGRKITLELLPTGPAEKVSNDVNAGSARDAL